MNTQKQSGDARLKNGVLNNAASASGYSVCGLVVLCHVELAGKVSNDLEKIAGVEVHGGEAGKLVVTVEELPGEKKLIDRVTEINNTSGVLSASLIYTETDSGDSDSTDDNVSRDSSDSDLEE